MIRKLTLVFAALFLCGLHANAQFCGFDHQHNKLLANDPGYAQRLLSDNARYVNAMQNGGNSLVSILGVDTTFEIPVVIHVMNVGGAHRKHLQSYGRAANCDDHGP